MRIAFHLVAFAIFAFVVFGSSARAQTAADVSAAASQTCAVMSGTQKADSRTLQYLLLLDEDMGDANPVALALFHQVMARCPKSYLAYEQRKRAVNPFPPGSLTKGTPTQLTGGPATLTRSANSSDYAMRCIGTKGMASSVGPTLSVAFRRASDPAALRPGECTFLDRGVRPAEPALITGPITGAGVAQRVAIDVDAGETWTFWVYNTGSSFHITALAQGIRNQETVTLASMSPKTETAADFLPAERTIANLRAAAATCRGCDLFAHATQTVFGEGDPHARLVFVGEQPGDREDIEGRPFVGPAGNLLRSSLREAGIDERSVYITNTVKHFKFIERGKRRIHATPKRFEIRSCEPWLTAEIAEIAPDLVVALGATAATTLIGPTFRLTQHRGEVVTTLGGRRAIATIHPSAILRSIDAETRAAETLRFIEDLRLVKETLDSSSADR